MLIPQLSTGLICSAVLVSGALAQATRKGADDPEVLWGHSAHGAAYDSGPRQQPWKMEGIGHTPFPISSSVPEVQGWFDQGVALLHSFWYYEEERSFRWCLKLDPECAMAYWGLALSVREGSGSAERNEEFLREAEARMEHVTERERGYIEAAVAFSEAKAAKQAGDEDASKLLGEAMVRMDRLAMDHPDDLEAKALYWLLAGRALGETGELARYGMEAVLDSILVKNPEHVGALHYRVHNWDGKEGRYAVDTCMLLGELGSGSGHLLHMPGHVLSGIGLWHEAGIAMDRATRVEKEYMNERMILPEDNWNYIHNLHYLSYIQEQLGMVDQALFGARQLLNAPASPEGGLIRTLSRNALMRALVKFERWETILDPAAVDEAGDTELDQAGTAYARMRAHLGLGQLEETEDLLGEWATKTEQWEPEAGTEEDPNAWVVMLTYETLEEQLVEIEARLALARGERLEGLALLSSAAEAQQESWENDPPREACYLYNTLGEQYLEFGAPLLAVECFERTLETVFHDGFALAGLVVAHHQLGNAEDAREAMAKLQVVWSDAERPNRWLEAAEATGVRADPFLEAPVQQRNYKREILDVHGPSVWLPTPAPSIAALNAQGESVQLADYRGQSVVLIFYLGEQCVHCIEQIALAEEHLESIQGLNAVVLGVSKDSVERIAGQQDSLGVVLLSDPEFACAKRFKSFDDFEELELHSTFLIDPRGQVHWSRIGGEPFTKFDFLIEELRKLDQLYGQEVANAK